LLLDILKLKSTHKTEKTAVLGRPTAFPNKSVEERNADRMRLKNGIEKERICPSERPGPSACGAGILVSDQRLQAV
jgi:hypothetical protein